jgi:hypothetical protein
VSHPSPGLLVDLARGTSRHTDVLRSHLDGCEPCRRALDRFHVLVRAAGIAHEIPPHAPMTIAHVVLNDRSPPAGLRGRDREDRHLLFEAAPWAIDLRVQRRNGALNITGQLANATSPMRGCAGVPVLARSPDAVVGRGLTGSLGEFTIACADVSPLTLEIRVSYPGIAIGIPPPRD